MKTTGQIEKKNEDNLKMKKMKRTSKIKPPKYTQPLKSRQPKNLRRPQIGTIPVGFQWNVVDFILRLSQINSNYNYVLELSLAIFGCYCYCQIKSSPSTLTQCQPSALYTSHSTYNALAVCYKLQGQLLHYQVFTLSP